MREGKSSAAILIALWIGPIMPLTGPEVGANGWRPHLHSISLIEQRALGYCSLSWVEDQANVTDGLVMIQQQLFTWQLY